MRVCHNWPELHAGDMAGQGSSVAAEVCPPQYADRTLWLKQILQTNPTLYFPNQTNPFLVLDKYNFRPLPVVEAGRNLHFTAYGTASCAPFVPGKRFFCLAGAASNRKKTVISGYISPGNHPFLIFTYLPCWNKGAQRS
jgi:hypothetical protein